MRESTETSASVQIKLIRKYLKLKLLEDNVTLRNHLQERNHVYNLLQMSILHGQSHSALITGARGCGKITLVNSVLHQLSQEVDLARDAHIIRLNGFIHHDEKIALKAITTQMQLNNVVGDRVFGTFAENLAFLLSCLRCGADKRCRTMVFVLEEFDMFCGKSQTLLYNLFDITHSQQAPMCVLGITHRTDVMELIEKRVKSRFSDRYIRICPVENSVQNPRAPLETYLELLVELLTVPLRVVRTETPRKKKGTSRKRALSTIDEHMDVDQDYLQNSIPEVVLHRCKVDLEQFSQLEPSSVEEWNDHVRSLAEQQRVVDAVEMFCFHNPDEPLFRNLLFQVISKLCSSKPNIDANVLISAIDNAVATEHRVKMLQSISILELSLVIAMMHSMEIFDGEPFNFEMVFHRYTKFAQTNSTTQSVPRPVILKAFEHLQALEIILPVVASDSIYSSSETTACRVQKEYNKYTLAVPVDDIRQAVKTFKALPTEIAHWFSNSVF